MVSGVVTVWFWSWTGSRRADLALDDLEDVSDPVGGVAPGVVADARRVAGDADRDEHVAPVEAAGLGGTAAEGERGERTGRQVARGRRPPARCPRGLVTLRLTSRSAKSKPLARSTLPG